MCGSKVKKTLSCLTFSVITCFKCRYSRSYITALSLTCIYDLISQIYPTLYQILALLLFTNGKVVTSQNDVKMLVFLDFRKFNVDIVSQPDE